MKHKSHYKATSIINTGVHFLPQGKWEQYLNLCSVICNFSPSEDEKLVRNPEYNISYNTLINGRSQSDRVLRELEQYLNLENQLLPSSSYYFSEYLSPAIREDIPGCDFVFDKTWQDSALGYSVEYFLNSKLFPKSRFMASILPSAEILLLFGDLLAEYVQNRPYDLLDYLRLNSSYNTDDYKSKKFKKLKNKKYLSGDDRYKFTFDKTILDRPNLEFRLSDSLPIMDIHAVVNLQNSLSFAERTKSYSCLELISISLKDRNTGISVGFPWSMSFSDLWCLLFLLIYNKNVQSNKKYLKYIKALKPCDTSDFSNINPLYRIVQKYYDGDLCNSGLDDNLTLSEEELKLLVDNAKHYIRHMDQVLFSPDSDFLKSANKTRLNIANTVQY